MNAMINYLLEVNVGLLLFVFVYWAALRDETQFTLKRAYLLFALISSLTFPLFHFNVPASTQAIPSIGQLIPTYWLPEIVINSNGSASTAKLSLGLSIWTVTERVYLIATLFLFVLFFYRIVSIVKLFTNSHTYRWRNYFVSETDEAKPTFSFFQFILIGQANQLDEKEKEEILIHESIHIKKWHSLDVLLVNMVGIVCWFNPIIRIYKKELVQLHEFEADARSVENKDVEMYCGLPAKVALQSADFPLANHFNNSLTLKRINMMKTKKRKIQTKKVVALAMLTCLFFIVLACQEQLKKEEKNPINSDLLSQMAKEEFKSLERYFDDLKIIEVSDKNKETLEELGYYSGKPTKEFPSIIFSGTGTKDGAGFVIVGKAKSLKKNESKVFDKVDEIAAPVFGMNSLYENIAHTLVYPEEARKKGIEGKVFIEFVLQTNGEMTDFKVAKGIDDSVDTEALRALMQIDTKWRPAIHQSEIVKMKMVIPIVFKLDSSEKKDEASTIKSPVMDELVAVGKRPN
jgi:TonB family protein